MSGQGRPQSVGSESVSDEVGAVDGDHQDVVLENGLLVNEPVEREGLSFLLFRNNKNQGPNFDEL